jgi:hypothetical protein
MALKLHQAGLSYAMGRISRGKKDLDSEWSFTDEERNTLLGEGTIKDFGLWHLGEDTDQDEGTTKRFAYPYGKGGKVFRSALANIVVAIKRDKKHCKNKDSKRASEEYEALDRVEAEARKLESILDQGKAASQQFVPLGDPAKPFGVVLADPAYAICAEDFDMIQGGGMRGWTQICRTGSFKGHWQGPFGLDDDMLSVMQVNFNRYSNPMPFDYGHEAVWNSAFLASGWGHEMKLVREGNALFSNTEWTPKASQHIRDGEYKYISPVILFETPDPFTGEDLGPSIWTVALLNTPFLRDMDPVEIGRQVAATAQKLNHVPPRRMWTVTAPAPAAGTPCNEPPAPAEVNTVAAVAAQEDDVERKMICKVLGLPETATDQEIEKALESQKALAAQATTGAQALTAAKTETDRVALEAKTAKDRILALEAEKKAAAEREAKDLVEAYVKAGRIAPASRTSAENLALGDRASFETLYGKPSEPGRAVVPMGAVATPDPASFQSTFTPGASGTLTDEDRDAIEKLRPRLEAAAQKRAKRTGKPCTAEECFLEEKARRTKKGILGRTFPHPPLTNTTRVGG